MPLDEATTRTISAVAALLNLGLLIVLVAVTKGYADSTRQLASETARLAETTAASVEEAKQERSDRRAGILRAVAAEIQRTGGIAQQIMNGDNLPEPARTEILARHVVDLASVVAYEVYFEAWHFAEQLRMANNLWAWGRRNIPAELLDDFDEATRIVHDESGLVSSLLILAIGDAETALAGAKALAAKRRADFDQRYGRVRAGTAPVPAPPGSPAGKA